MTKEELKQYRSIVAELNEVNDRINSNTTVLSQALTLNFRTSSTVFLYRVLSQRIYRILCYVSDWNDRKIKLNCLLPVYWTVKHAVYSDTGT